MAEPHTTLEPVLSLQESFNSLRGLLPLNVVVFILLLIWHRKKREANDVYYKEINYWITIPVLLVLISTFTVLILVIMTYDSPANKINIIALVLAVVVIGVTFACMMSSIAKSMGFGSEKDKSSNAQLHMDLMIWSTGIVSLLILIGSLMKGSHVFTK